MRKPYLSKTVRAGLNEIATIIDGIGRTYQPSDEVIEAITWIRRMEEWRKKLVTSSEKQ